MPRSKDPRNYPSFYEDLAIIMDSGEQEIVLDTTGRNAIYIRNNFYAYINAWKHTAETTMRKKALPEEERHQLIDKALRMEEIMRAYLVVIDPEPDPTLEAVKLRFIYRHMDPRHADVAAQLSKIMEETKALDKITAREAERSQALQRLGGGIPFREIDMGKMRGKDSPVAHFFTGVKTKIAPDMTDALADEILSADPPDRTDLTELITPSNQGDSPTKTYTEQAMKAADKLRDKERE